jgi:putative FmdB family regulatory protein
MPIYEYYCLSCDLTFELLTSLSESTKKKPCPECGRKAPRTVSAFAIASGGNSQQAGQPVATQPHDPRPLCMKYPQVPLSCHMDEPSLKRFVAHMRGRGAEYDDKQAAASELRKQRSLPEPVATPPSHGHDHHHFRRHGASQTTTQNNTSAHDHGHSHTHDHGRSHKKEKSHSHSHAHGAHAH